MGDQIKMFRVGGRLQGVVPLPTSKSIAQRVLLAAMAAEGTTRVGALPDGEDVLSALSLARSFGGLVEDTVSRSSGPPQQVAIQGRPPAGGRVQAQHWSAGESGTLGRCAAALAGLGLAPGCTTTVEGSGSLLKRRSPALMRALDRAGVHRTELGIDAGWPLILGAVEPPVEVLLESPESSQEVSGLLLALAAWDKPHRLRVRGNIPSGPYVRMTMAVLRSFDVDVHQTEEEGGRSYLVEGPLQAPQEIFPIEPDASAAAVALVAGCLSGGAVQVPGLGLESCQGDVRVIDYLQAFGCQAGERSTPEGAELFATGLPTQGVDLDLSGEPDLAPALVPMAAAAAEAGFPSRLTGLVTLDKKESPRLTVLLEGLEACGFNVVADAESLSILPGRQPRNAPVLDARGDHRMFFAWSLLGWVVPGLGFTGLKHVGKSWPRFREDLAQAGAEWEESHG